MDASPRARFDAQVEAGTLREDPAQAIVIAELERIYHALLASPAKPTGWRGWLSRFSDRSESGPVRGLYLWGGVGRGKTHLVNLFHESLPFEEKRRVHFHRFMQRVHRDLKQLVNQEDPLLAVAAQLATEFRVLCFDEFHVSDIADAMILAKLLDALFERGVCLVATSNTVPNELYQGGLQRSQFLPAIDLINRHTVVLELDSPQDYRLRVLTRAATYFYPLDDNARVRMREQFEALRPNNVSNDTEIRILGRPIRTKVVADGMAWFEFSELCESARSTGDYIELARGFHTVFLSGVPSMGADASDSALRFIHLVDELYDRNVNLVLSASVPPTELYDGERLAASFQRTASRLQEMQSKEYLSRTHLP